MTERHFGAGVPGCRGAGVPRGRVPGAERQFGPWVLSGIRCRVPGAGCLGAWAPGCRVAGGRLSCVQCCAGRRAILAATFFATSLVLSILAGLDRKPRSIIQNTGTPAQQTPGAPLGQGGGGVLDTLRQQEQPPAAPAGPQVPRSQ